MSILTVSSAAGEELWLVINYDMKRKKLWKLPANNVPADPLISPSSSGAIDPSGSRWESNSVEVYDGIALPDIYGSMNENLCATWFHSSLTMSDLTCWNGISIMASTAFRVSKAFILNIENGAHVGMCLQKLGLKED